MGQADHVEHALLLDALAGLAQRNVGGHVGDPEVALRQHHGIIPGVGEIGVDFRVPGIVMAGGVDGRLVDGARHGGIDLARPSPARSPWPRSQMTPRPGRAVTCLCLNWANGKCCRSNTSILPKQNPASLTFRHAATSSVNPQKRTASAIDVGIPHHDRPADGVHFRQRQRLGADFGPDPARIAHGYADDRKLGYTHSLKSWFNGSRFTVEDRVRGSGFRNQGQS